MGPRRMPEMAWSATGIKNRKPRPNLYEVANEHGMLIEVLPTGAKVFR